jgi:transposase
MDRAYLDFGRLYALHQAGSFFVTRAKANLDARRVYSRGNDRAAGLVHDQTIALNGYLTRRRYPAHLRRIRFKDPDTGKRLVFLTNQFALPADQDIHLVCDNYSTHKTREVKAWFAKRPRYHAHFTPTHSSWLNQVERWFALLSARAIKRGTHRSTLALEKAIGEYIEASNEDPKPIVWSKSADEILDSIARYCSRILTVHGTQNIEINL